MVQLAEIRGLQRILVLSLAAAAPYPNILRGLQIQRDPFHSGKLAPQPPDHLIRAHLAFGKRLEGHEETAIVARG